MHPTRQRYVSSTEVLDFVSRTTGHGVPLRIAIQRAEKRFGIEKGLIRALVRSAA